MPEVMISPELKNRCPGLRLGCIEANVVVASSGDALMSEIQQGLEILQGGLIIEEISKIPAIEASRKAYRACGKDPSRYRLSAEALLRRVVSGKGLYQINNVVDQLNLVSVTSGFSIGGYDLDNINGNIRLGIGQPQELYAGIGKGDLNIENLPVFRDEDGAFGTPTSDSQRTQVSHETTRFLMIVIDFESSAQLDPAMEMAVRLLKEHCQGRQINQYNIC